jgi:AraC family transcriptional regulator
MQAAVQNYHARMQRVLDHIDQHLKGNLDLDALSGVAAFSKYHFHRQFTATFGLSVHRYVQLARQKSCQARESKIFLFSRNPNQAYNPPVSPA